MPQLDATQRTVFSAPVSALAGETDGGLWIPAFDFFFDVGTWTLTRDAAGNYKMRKTAAANTAHPSIMLVPYFLDKIGTDPAGGVAAAAGVVGVGGAVRPGSLASGAPLPAGTGHDMRGVQVTEVDVVYAIGTAALTAHTAVLTRATYANNAAPVTAAPTTFTGTLATATQAQPYVSALTIVAASRYTLGTNTALVADGLELTVDASGAATAVYDLYGCYVRFNYNYL